ncbi:MAG TPA: glycine/sarcosine/betaine reductase complex component C subunit beta [Symbiobacteriaceae bacterium]|nr:glycine/sarcosine/betaine reductase complex component C subunit beta [Symbiobacteriaceae bacterium]
MTFPVLKGSAYCLVHAPEMLLHYGTTPATERTVNPGSEYLRRLPEFLRSYEAAVGYAPNQAYLGRFGLGELAALPRPWYEKSVAGAERFGPYGELMPEPEFIALMKVVDTFDLVWLEESFAVEVAARFADHPVLGGFKLGAGKPAAELEARLGDHSALPLYYAGGRLAGIVRRAHDVDETLSAHVVFENLVTKASAVLAFKHLLSRDGVKAEQVEYIIECSEEACGDMNQRGGGNFAKAIGEVVGCVNATGSDTRAFCAAPTHALIEAAALVQSGVYKHVVVVAGGTPAKLGLNSRDHVNKNIPAVEDVIGAFAVLVSEDDFVSPRVRLDVCGRHKIGSGSSPQAVMEALITEPLDRAGLKITDVDKYGVEMQNPECTETAGAGDVPKSNYKLIAALAVKRGEIARTDIEAFAGKHGFVGFAPTQGHIPSGVPVIGPVRELIMQGQATRAMIIGKGSLFLGRMTNLFDGVSFVMEKNPGRPSERVAVERTRTRVGVTVHGSELGEAEVVRGAELAQRMRPDLEVVLIGNPGVATSLCVVGADCIGTAHREMENRLRSGDLAAAVTLHYPFPIGVATVGKVVTPGKGREMFLATTTGTAAADRVEAMVRSAIYGVACAKAAGIAEPTLGVLNLEGAPQVEKILGRLAEAGYASVRWATSGRADGGALMRGNDVLGGTPDVLVTDSLTGNVLMKVMSAYTTGGSYEALGCGYGPGVGENQKQIIHIISRASGAPVIAGAITYAGDMAVGGLVGEVASELAAARAAGLDRLLAERGAASTVAPTATPVAPPEKVATAEISGVEIMALEDAVHCLWAKGVYARPGMGCTGPVVLVAPEDLAGARGVLAAEKYL